MIETCRLILVFIAGVALGAIFFGGLWWTVRLGLSSARPAVWFLGSYLVRTAVSLSGFYFATRGDWRNLLACLLGFVIARLLVTRLTSAPLENNSQIATGSAL